MWKVRVAGIMVGLALAAILVIWIDRHAHAQNVDWCAVPLPMQADTHKPMAAQSDPSIVWRLRCTIQKLAAERAEALNQATNFAVQAAEAEAKLRAATEAKPIEPAKPAKSTKK